MSNEKSSKLPIIVALLIGFVGGVVFTFWGKVEPYRERDQVFLEKLEEKSKYGVEFEKSLLRSSKSVSKHGASESSAANDAMARGHQSARDTYVNFTEENLKEPEWFR